MYSVLLNIQMQVFAGGGWKNQVGPLDARSPAIGFVPMMTGGGGGNDPIESFIALKEL
jgi:hypothetical protein